MIGASSLCSLAEIRPVRSRRVSSYDAAGGNHDCWDFKPGQTRVVAALSGAGCIRHIWMTIGSREKAYPRRMVLRMYWDGEANPSVEAPIGDFFGIGHGILKNFVSAPLQMSPQDGKGMNCYFPMPFAESARIEATNEGQEGMALYFYIDYEEMPEIPSEWARFHAQWRRQNPTRGWGYDLPRDAVREMWKHPNTTGEDNYVVLEARGRGHYVGCNLNVDCFAREKNDWYGEGDDMIFIDGEPWPPSLHGTGTEDYFSMAYCPRTEYCAPYHGLTLYSGTPGWPWKGKNSMYRYHIEDPVHFDKSIKVTIEHGHANKLSNDYSSTAYWYQFEPHRKFPKMLPVAKRLPRPDEPEYAVGGKVRE